AAAASGNAIIETSPKRSLAYLLGLRKSVQAQKVFGKIDACGGARRVEAQRSPSGFHALLMLSKHAVHVCKIRCCSVIARVCLPIIPASPRPAPVRPSQFSPVD